MAKKSVGEDARLSELLDDAFRLLCEARGIATTERDIQKVDQLCVRLIDLRVERDIALEGLTYDGPR